jgi:hypothetical protein
LLGRVYWPALLFTPVAAVTLALVVLPRPVTFQKGPLEEAALWITGGFATACLLRFAVAREPYFVWSAVVMATLMGREIRFPGASTGVYIALALLGAYALRHLGTFWPRLARPALLTGLGVGFFTYVFSVAIDQRWARGVPGEEVWQMPVEEMLEILGHTLIGLSLVSSRRLREPVPVELKIPTVFPIDSR